MVLPEIAKISYSDLSEISRVSEKILQLCEKYKVWAFEGEMGAGKTTLIKSICERLGVKDNVSSPTFSIVNEYHSVNNKIIYHFDFYRIKNEEEAMDIGAEEYFYSGNFCFIEWPSKIESLLPPGHIMIRISLNNQERLIEIFENTSADF
jgi:tRNA threonylcarbamoyladenosine biosynthesis protein TsaE